MSISATAPQLIEHVSHSLNYTPFDVRWVPASAKFISLGSEPRGTGLLQLYELEGNSVKVLAQASHKAGLKCCTFGAASYENRSVAIGDYSGNLSVFSITDLNKPTFHVAGHSSMINCLDGIGGLNVGNGAPELVTGGRDGCVKVWDVRQNEAVSALEPAAGQTPRDCWSVCFGNSFDDTERCVMAGYDNGDIKLWDLKMGRIRWETNVNNGVVNVQFDRRDIKMNKLVVTSLESKFRVYDMRTFHPVEGYAYSVEQAHKSTVWLARHLPQNRDIWMTTGGNGTLNLYKYSYPDQRSITDTEGNPKGVMGTISLLNSRKFSDQPIVGFDWNQEKQGLCVMTALDQTIKVGIVTKLKDL